MGCQLNIATMGPVLGDGGNHIRKTRSAVIGLTAPVGPRFVQLTKGMIIRCQGGQITVLFAHPDHAAEIIGVGQPQGALGPVEFHIRVAAGPDIPAGPQGDDRAGVEFQQRMDIGGRVNRDLFTVAQPIADGAGGKTGRRHRRHRSDRPQQLNEIGDIIGPEVQNRPAPRLKKEIRVRMPMLHPA
ncbi:hypothetical protein PHIN109289_18410 [Phaeobacter inhibens]